MAGVGHNSDDQYSVTADELRSFMERVEQLEREKKELQDDIKEVFAEAKGRGYNIPIMRIILRERKRKPDDLAEQEAVLDMYRAALGMVTAAAYDDI